MNEQENAALPPEYIEQLRSMPDWKRRQLIQAPPPRVLQPTLQQRVNRLPPQERHQLRAIVRSKFLRATIRRVLAEAAYLGAPQPTLLLHQTTSLQRLQRTVRTIESLRSYESSLTSCDYSDPRNDAAKKHMRVTEHGGGMFTAHIDLR